MSRDKSVTNDNLTFEPEEQYSWSDDPKQLAMAQHPAESTAIIFHQRERWRIWKNIFLISFSFMCLFTAFQSTSNLQSSINATEGLGTASLTAIYMALLISCLLLPSLVMKKLTCKWTMVTCTFCYVAYVVAQFYPRLYTLIPAGILVGLGGAPLWAAKCTYLTQAGMIYADITKQDAEPVIVKFFGLFFLLFQFSQVIGNLISSILLQPEHGNFNPNLTMETIAATCGSNFCEQSAHVVENSNLDRPPESKLFVLTSTFLVLAILSSLVIAFFVDNLKRYGEAERSVAAEELGPLQLLSATVAHLKKPYQLLIIPLTMWSGFEQAFITADFTKGYIACACGVHQIGLVLIVYGVCDAICSISFGFVIKKIGRVPIFLFGAMINFAMIGIMLTWTPNPDEFHMFFVIAALWGIADAVWQTQINAFYGVIFPMTPEAAFSNYRLWESLGFTIQFAYSGYICVSVKMYILIAVLSIGMLGYVVIEICEWKQEVSPDEEEDSY